MTRRIERYGPHSWTSNSTPLKEGRWPRSPDLNPWGKRIQLMMPVRLNSKKKTKAATLRIHNLRALPFFIPLLRFRARAGPPYCFSAFRILAQESTRETVRLNTKEPIAESGSTQK